jgi:signal transduction histidine kinase
VLLGGILALIVGVLLARWLVKPLQQLEIGATAVARRELDYRVPVRGSAEMRSAATAYNQMAGELERQESLRLNLLTDVTHELRHPVHILQGNLQAILDGVYPLSMEESGRLLEKTQGLAHLVNDLHELAQAEARQLPLFMQDTDLKKLVDHTVETFQSLVEEERIQLEVSLPAEGPVLEVDSDRIRQAFYNLLSNAVRYSPEGGDIQIALKEGDDSIQIAVQDHGIGIKAEELSKVFDRFYRADEARDRGVPGTGLGLAIAQAIVQAHDGQIDVYSAGLNQGSTFTIRIPVRAE